MFRWMMIYLVGQKNKKKKFDKIITWLIFQIAANNCIFNLITSSNIKNPSQN